MAGFNCLGLWHGLGPALGVALPDAPAEAYSDAVRQDLAVVPNPTSSGAATLRYSLPEAGPATVRVFDITGRSVLTQALSTGRGASGVSLDLRGLSAGVYLLTFEAGGWRQSRKLVVE